MHGPADPVRYSVKPRLMRFRSVLAMFWMKRAVDDAARRLRNPECQRILTDLADPSGQLLSINLRRLEMTPAEFVERGLWFVDASDEPQCLIDFRAAFTSSGSRVIFICAARLFPPNSGPGEAAAARLVVIHEALHALGLAENPPKSSEITRQVVLRCGSDPEQSEDPLDHRKRASSFRPVRKQAPARTGKSFLH
jgi:hypothetical protein